MQREVATFFGGVGLLIFAYLVLTQAAGFGMVASSASSLFGNSVAVLQGRGGSTGGGGNPFANFGSFA